MKVLIIGAGIAGITAARELIQNGVDVEIIEARDRVGGRIAPASNFPYPIDIGASWIHGVDGNPLTQVAQQLNLKLDITDNPNLTGSDSLEIYNEQGQIINPSLQDSLRNRFKLMLESGRKLLDSHPTDISFEEMLQHTASTPEEHHFMEWLKSGIEGWDSSPLADLSARNHFWEHDDPLFSGGDGFVCNGFYRIVQELSRDVKVRLGSEVKKVVQTKDYVTLETTTGNYTADYVICTLPLGVLKQGNVAWEPALPIWKKTAIHRLGFGTMNKIILEFNDCFWNKKSDGIGYVSSQYRGEFGFFLNLFPQIQRPVLMGFVAADFAKHLESWSDDQIVGKVMGILERIYGKNVGKPTKIQITRWGSDPYARGSYSFMKVHSTPQHVQDLARNVGRVHFAGEATAKYPGYTHGAYMSAKREAEKILKMRQEKKEEVHVIVPPLIPVLTSKL